MARDRSLRDDANGGDSTLTCPRAVLLLTRDTARGGSLIAALQDHGIPAILATSARWALFWARQIPPSLVVVDLRAHQARLLVSQLRQEGQAITVLADDAKDRTWALQLGCLDAYAPSIDLEEFASKVVSLVRERQPRLSGRVASGPLEVDLRARRLVWKGSEVQAPRLALEVAACLARHAGEFVSARALLQEVWGEPWADSNKVHQAIWRLRRCLREPAGSPYLVGQRGGDGYGFFPAGVMPDGLAASGMPQTM